MDFQYDIFPEVKLIKCKCRYNALSIMLWHWQHTHQMDDSDNHKV